MDNNMYQQTTEYTPAPNMAYQPVGEEPVSLGDWIGTILLFQLIPCIGLIVYLVWAFSKDTKPSKKNFCRAWLIYYAVLTVISIILGFVFVGYIGAFMAQAMNSGMYPMY